MKVATLQERLNALFDSDPRNDTAIAAALGVSKQTVSAWRSGDRSPAKKMVMKISEMYQVSLEWLMGFDVEKQFGPLTQPMVIPNTEGFKQIISYMSHDDYVTMMQIFERAYEKMKEMGVKPL